MIAKRAEKAADAHGILAQLGEHLPYKQGVTGSSPVGPIDSVNEYGGVAQLARACGSYPQCQEFESPLRYVWGLAGSAEMCACKFFYCNL